MQRKKVCLFSTGVVGKSRIVDRFVNKRYQDGPGWCDAGCTCVQTSRTFQDIVYNFDIWDLTGLDVYRRLASVYYKNAAAALIVYDITNQNSFDAVDSWISELRSMGPKEILIYVIGNKVDLEWCRAVDREEAESYAQTKGVFHFHSSAKTGEGVEEIFYHMCQMELTKCSEKEDGCMHHQGTVDLSNSTNSDRNKHGHCHI